jgi:hypothetical protein
MGIALPFRLIGSPAPAEHESCGALPTNCVCPGLARYNGSGCPMNEEQKAVVRIAITKLLDGGTAELSPAERNLVLKAAGQGLPSAGIRSLLPDILYHAIVRDGFFAQ